MKPRYTEPSRTIHPLLAALLLPLASLPLAGCPDDSAETRMGVRIPAQVEELSGIVPASGAVDLRARGWDAAFWVVGDEALGKSLALLGRSSGQSGAATWELLPVAASGATPSAEDSEALAGRGGYVYVIGSHFGRGRLDPSRQFFARFDEVAAIRTDVRDVRIEVLNDRLLLHRRVNDALRESGISLIPGDASIEAAFIGSATEDAPVRPGDRPLNIEGACFLESGSLLLGLRFPVTAAGEPIAFELAGVERAFQEGPEALEVRRVFFLEGVGSREEPRGIRALSRVGERIHAIGGNLDSNPEKSLVLRAHPEGERAASAHYVFTLPPVGQSYGRAELVRDLAPESQVQGIAPLRDDFFYVSDEQLVRLFRSP